MLLRFRLFHQYTLRFASHRFSSWHVMNNFAPLSVKVQWFNCNLYYMPLFCKFVYRIWVFIKILHVTNITIVVIWVFSYFFSCVIDLVFGPCVSLLSTSGSSWCCWKVEYVIWFVVLFCYDYLVLISCVSPLSTFGSSWCWQKVEYFSPILLWLVGPDECASVRFKPKKYFVIVFVWFLYSIL